MRVDCRCLVGCRVLVGASGVGALDTVGARGEISDQVSEGYNCFFLHCADWRHRAYPHRQRLEEPS